MRKSFEEQSHESWQHLGTVPAHEVEGLFSDSNDEQGRIRVSQGYEGVSGGDWVVSSGFAQCSARILLNEADGCAFLKHIGPRSSEVVFGGSSGKGEQDEYVDFLAHAAATKSRVFAVNVKGGISHHSIERRYQSSAPEGVIVVELPEIVLDSGGKYTWALALNPKTSEMVTKTKNEDGEVVYGKYQLPSTKFEGNQSSRDILVEQVERRRLLNRCIQHLGRLHLSSPDFQNIVETREGIEQNRSLLSKMNEQELYMAESDWIRSFTRRSELSTDPQDFVPGLEALDILTSAFAWTKGKDPSDLVSLHKYLEIVEKTIYGLDRLNSHALSVGGPILLEHFRARLQAIAGESREGNEARRHAYIIESMGYCQEIIEKATSKIRR